MAQFEHFRITTAALRLTTVHTSTRAVVGNQVGNQTDRTAYGNSRRNHATARPGRLSLRLVK
eukprot:1443791-Prymnesium_polylepis.1